MGSPLRPLLRTRKGQELGNEDLMLTQLNIVSDTKGNAPLTFSTVDDADTETEASLDRPVSNTRLALAMRVSGVLQTTLDLDQLVALFSAQIKPAIPHDGLTYHNDELGIVASQGRKGRHSCGYRLLIDHEPIGEVTLTRRWEYSSEEMKTLEYTLCSLVYPLRNAILYRRALHAAHKDPLTGAFNRSTLDETLNREIRLAQRYKRHLSLLVLDIDFFKRVNDTYGHGVGDCVIKSVADRIAACIRSTDILFRYGGEEFVVLLSNTDSEGAFIIAERIRCSVERTLVQCGSNTIGSTLSIGISKLTETDTHHTLFARADAALYTAKHDGRNRCQLG